MKHHPRLVVLVPGYLAGKGSLYLLKRRLSQAGFRVKIAKLPLLNLGCMEEGSKLLAEQVAGWMQKYEYTACDLVGTSIGGLIALHAAKRLLPQGSIHTVVGVGTPFAGTWASMAGILASLGHSLAAWQMLPGSPFLRELHGDGPAKYIKTYSISAFEDPFAPPKACHLDGAEEIELEGFPRLIAHQFMVASQEIADAVEDVLVQADKAV